RRIFRRRLRSAVQAVDRALQFAARVSDGSRRNPVFARTLQGLAVPHMKSAKAALEAIPIEFANFMRPRSGDGFKDAKQDARLTLMDFFIRRCGLRASIASVRTAKIGNGLLGWHVN